MSALVEVDRRGNVAVLRMRAGKANAMTERFFEAVDAVLEEVDDADALVFTGEGSAFSAGLALPELIDLARDGMLHVIAMLERAMKRVLGFPRATVAAINGHAIAGGCVLALMCDVRVMSAGNIGLTEAQLGVGLPSIVIEALRIRVPATSLGAIALEGRLFAPKEALRVGLVDEVVDPAKLDRALELAAKRAAAPLAYAQIKRALLAPLLQMWDRKHETERDAWLDTWFSEYARKTLRAAVDRISKK
jgi:enoyl-CoA hydratase